jgi:nucleoid-associated protein YgaU
MKTNMLVTIEDFSVSEVVGSTGEWDYSINLKEYRVYKSQKVTTSNKTKTVQVSENRSNDKKTNKTYAVKSDDSLWIIAKKELNDGAKYASIYELNKNNIDKRNKGTGSSKYTIYVGQVLRIE